MEADEEIPGVLLVGAFIAFMIYQADPNIISHIKAVASFLGAVFDFIINVILVIFVIIIAILGYAEIKHRF